MENVSSFGPFRGLSTSNFDKADVVIKGIPFDGGASQGKGTCEAPDKVRELSANLVPVTENGILMKDFHIYDGGDFPLNIHIDQYFDTIHQESKTIFETGKFPLFIGGDHSVTIPLQQAFLDTYGAENKQVGIVHFDAHPDIIDEYLGSKISHASTNCRSLEHEYMKAGDLTMIGIRCFEECELNLIEKKVPQVTVYSAYECFEQGIKNICDQVIEKYLGYDTVYVTFDIDCLDPAFAPGTGTPEAGGLSTRDALNLVRPMIQRLPVKGMDIVEISPPLDVRTNITTFAGLKIMYEVFGQLAQKNKVCIENTQPIN